MTDAQYNEIRNALGWLLRVQLRRQVLGSSPEGGSIQGQMIVDRAHKRILGYVENIFRCGYQEDDKP